MYLSNSITKPNFLLTGFGPELNIVVAYVGLPSLFPSLRFSTSIGFAVASYLLKSRSIKTPNPPQREHWFKWFKSWLNIYKLDWVMLRGVYIKVAQGVNPRSLRRPLATFAAFFTKTFLASYSFIGSQIKTSEVERSDECYKFCKGPN